MIGEDGLEMSEEETWWGSEGENLQGIPNSLETTPQQIFVTHGQGVPVATSASAMIIVAVTFAIISLCCCQPLAIIPLIMGAVKMNETSKYSDHPDISLAILSVLLSVLALGFFLLRLVLDIAMEL